MSRSRFEVLIAFALLLFASSTALAQRSARSSAQPIPAQINGQVRYAQGGAPAFNILVTCEVYGGGLVGQEQTDRNGKFRFTGLKPAQYNVIIHVPGFQDEQQSV